METSHNQPLSIESFSYSWLVNLKPSLEGLLDNTSIDSCSFDDLSANSFIEMDPTMPPSKRFLRNSQDFKFDFPISQSPADLAHQLVHADQLFANGYLMPLCFVHDPLKLEAFDEASDNSSTLNSHLASLPAAINSKIGSDRKLTSCSSLRKCRKLSKRLFQKYLNFLVKPLYRRIRGSGGGRSSSSTTSRANHHHHHQNGDHHHRSRVHSWVYSAETSPRISVAYSADDCWRKSCDSESSIYEAVLHCKRSIGKSC